MLADRTNSAVPGSVRIALSGIFIGSLGMLGSVALSPTYIGPAWVMGHRKNAASHSAVDTKTLIFC